MIFRKQLIKHDPSNGMFGDCSRTAWACLFDLEPHNVPNFAESWDDIDEWTKRESEWLAEIGYTSLKIVYDCDLDDLFKYHDFHHKNVFYLLTGHGAGGVNHTVICKGGEIVFDPSPTNSGIIGPCPEDGMYWCDFPIQLRFTEIGKLSEAVK